MDPYFFMKNVTKGVSIPKFNLGLKVSNGIRETMFVEERVSNHIDKVRMGTPNYFQHEWLVLDVLVIGYS